MEKNNKIKFLKFARAEKFIHINSESKYQVLYAKFTFLTNSATCYLRCLYLYCNLSVGLLFQTNLKEV